MKLKLVVASMSVLGLISCPAFAATADDASANANDSANTSMTSVKHKHHHRHHQKMMKETTEAQNYKDTFKDQAPCMISPTTMTMVEMTQNSGRSLPNPCNPGWYNRIWVSGGANVDIGKWGNRNSNYMGENYQRVSLNDAYLNVAADASDWAKFFASISYDTATIVNNPSLFNNRGAAEYSAPYSNNIGGSNQHSVQLEQGFATLANFDVSPIFVQVGKQFQDFSRYEIHPITRSLTQVMSETLATSLKLGFLYNGFNGSLFAFDDPLTKVGGGSNTTTNYGAALGYDMPNDQFGWDIGAAYLYNMIGVNDVAFSVNNFVGTAAGAGYHSRVGAYALYGDLNTGPFTVGVRYTAAAQRFNVLDMTKNGFADLTAASAVLGSGTAIAAAAGAKGAEPWAAGIQAGYGFEGWGKNQNVYLGYQASNEAAGLNIPKNRWLAGYNVDMFQNVNLGAEWDHDNAYSASNGGTGNAANLVTLRAAVKFS